jgi:hypothetical protein
MKLPRKLSPMQLYRWMVVRRDWAIAKIEYLHSESAKWRGLFNVLKSPYSLLRAVGLSPQMAAGLLLTSTAVGSGVIVNETLLSGRSFARGDSGIYAAPADAPVSYIEGDNTLLIQLGSVPVGEIVIDSVTVGTAFSGSTLPSGQTNAVVVGGLPTSDGFTATWLEVGHLIINRWRCTTFRMEDTEVHTLNIKGVVADGLSIAPVGGTPRMRAVGGGNRAESMGVSNSTYDQIRIEAATSGVDGQVDTLTLTNLLTKGGGCLISRVKAGTITVELLVVGAGNGLSVKDFVIATSTVAKITNLDSNIEELISPP